MLVFFALGNAKVLSFALGDANVPNTNVFASQGNISVTQCISCLFESYLEINLLGS